MAWCALGGKAQSGRREEGDLSLQVHQQDGVVGLSVNVLTLPEFKTNCRVAPRNPQHPHISNLKHPSP